MQVLTREATVREVRGLPALFLVPVVNLPVTSQMLVLSCADFKQRFQAQQIDWDKPCVFELAGVQELLKNPDVMSAFSVFANSLSQHPASKIEGKGQRSLF